MGMNTEVAHSIGTVKSVSKFRPFRIQGINVGRVVEFQVVSVGVTYSLTRTGSRRNLVIAYSQQI